MALRVFCIFVIPAALSLDFDLTPRKPMSEVGDRLVLMCSARSCQNAVFVWRTLQDQPLMHTSVVRVSPNESHLVIHNVTLDHQTKIVCKADCGEGLADEKAANVNVYSFPAVPVVSGNDRLRPGEKNDLTCVVRDVYPAERLKIEWVQENTVLHETDEEGTDGHTDGTTQTSVFSYTPRSEDKEKTITCRATLDLTLEGEPLNQKTRETTAALTVKLLSLELDLEPSQPVSEVGDRLVLKCSARSCQNAVFVWRTLQDQPLMHTSVVRVSPNESHLVIHNVTLDHQTKIVCKADCGEGLADEKAANVNVYSFPAVPVVSGNDRLRPGEKNDLTCVVRDVYPAERLKIEWVQENTVLHETDEEGTDGATQTSVFSYTPRPEDKEKTITCRATLDLTPEEGPLNQKTRETTVALTVRSRPRNTWVRVTPAGELTEGQMVLIFCGSDSGPEGRVVLRRRSDGQETELQSSPSPSTSLTYTIPSVRLAHSGLYTCEASNQQGSEADSVRVQVHASPRNTTVTAVPSWRVQEGQNVTVSWRTASFPPASAVLRKESGGGELFSRDGTFSLLHLTPADAGLYQLNISNQLGYHTELLTLSVMRLSTSSPEDSLMLPKALIPALGTGAMVTMAVLMIRYLRKMKGRATYELAKHRPQTSLRDC